MVDSLYSEKDAADGAAQAQSWRRSLVVFLLLTVLFSLGVYTFILVMDPFSSGRFALTQRIDIATDEFRYSRVGTARDPRFNAAIFGASSSHALDPQIISEQTGWRIAQLTINGAAPGDQLIVARAFQRNHQHEPMLLIFALDWWCSSRSTGADPQETVNVPTWLYEGTTLEYLSHIMFPDSFSTALRRLRIWLGLTKSQVRADGHRNSVYDWPQRDLSLMSRPYDAAANPLLGPESLMENLASVPSETKVVLMFGPTYIGSQPAEGSPAAAKLAQCKQQFADFAASRPNTRYLDLMTDNEISRNSDFYTDGAHYKPGAARLIEQALVPKIKELGLPPQSQ